MPLQENSDESPLARFRRERKLSVNQLAVRTAIDRFTLSRWDKGIVPRLDLVERFARSYDLDVNAWRVANGYPAVELKGAAEATEAAPREDPTYEVDLGGHVVKAYGGGPIPPEDLEIIRAILEERARQRARKQGRE